MTVERQDITDSFYAGNSKVIRITVRDDSGNLKDLSGSEITWAMFTRDTDVMMLQKSSANGTGEIEVVGLGLCDIKLKSYDTANFYGTFRHHANVFDANGDEETVTSGKIEIHKAQARRYRKLSIAAYLNGQAP